MGYSLCNVMTYSWYNITMFWPMAHIIKEIKAHSITLPYNSCINFCNLKVYHLKKIIWENIKNYF